MKNKTIKNKFHTVIISDLHLGSRVSRSREVAEFLKNIKFQKLILLGDIFEDLNFNVLKENDWKFLSLVGELSKTKKVRWVEGNHDLKLSEIFGTLIGAKVYKVYKWRYKDKKYAAIHGHQFDDFLISYPLIGNLAGRIYNLIQIIDFSHDKKISRFVKRSSKGWLRLSGKVAKRAIVYAQLRGIDYIFCGHTHKAMELTKDGVSYYNSGCWTDVPSTYITLDDKGIKIQKYPG
ncbi:MAG: UDP-2,3-diacylglucosamine diphosphatase [Candidatus Moraniibacteriota bacterium]